MEVQDCNEQQNESGESPETINERRALKSSLSDSGNTSPKATPDISKTEESKTTPCEVSKTEGTIEFQLYKRRWIVLAVFSFISMSNEVIWISLSSITSVVKEYYNVDYLAVNWLSMIYMLFYVFVFLAALALDRLGLKFTIMIGAVLNGLGSCLRLIGTNRDGFIFVFLGNASAALAQCFILFVPPSLAATWFGENERATASALGVLMNMMGVAIGFLMGGTMVPGTQDYDGEVRDGMLKTLLIQAIFCTVMVILCLILVHDFPKSPPSMSQLLLIQNKQRKLEQKKKNKNISKGKQIESIADENQHMNFKTSLALLVKDVNFHLVAQAYGIYFGLFGAYNTVLNQMCMNHFPGKEQEIGLMGFTSVILGLIGILLAGIWLDRTRCYKLVSIGTFIACSVSLLTFTLILIYSGNFILVYVSFSIFGFFSYPYMTIGLEHAAEITYPISEGLTSGILLLFGNMYAITLTFICGAIIDKGRSDIAGYLMTVLYLVGMVTVILMKGELKRWRADISNKNDEGLGTKGTGTKGSCCIELKEKY
ncbi:heme transporter FLVCR2-like [Clytia hemisphaerica]|uniref:Major facilitator superfamily (MFS) profile domain-containing protein n=1 Tax=Clytia hemisphaerica TaxID=252671 RepID=A0A7M5XJ75_9CNID|eukprot:TCONS_00020016-protein